MFVYYLGARPHGYASLRPRADHCQPAWFAIFSLAWMIAVCYRFSLLLHSARSAAGRGAWAEAGLQLGFAAAFSFLDCRWTRGFGILPELARRRCDDRRAGNDAAVHLSAALFTGAAAAGLVGGHHVVSRL